MVLDEVVIFKCKGKLKAQLEEIAHKLGISQSCVARNTLAFAIMPPEKKSLLEEIMEKARRELHEELYKRENDGKETKES